MARSPLTAARQQMMSIRLSIVIVNWRSYGLTEACIRSIRRFPLSHGYEITVVDNSQDHLRRAQLVAAVPAIRWICNQTNVGFTKACNQGIRCANGEYILLLNPDVLVQSGCLDAMVSVLDAEPRVGIVSCPLVGKSGRRQRTAHDTHHSVRRLLLDTAGVSSLLNMVHSRGGHRPSPGSSTYSSVKWVKAACLMFRKNLVDELGLLDETFFLYGSDPDYCARAVTNGWMVTILRNSEMIHQGSATTSLESWTVASYYHAYLELLRRRYKNQRQTFQLARFLLALRASQHAFVLSLKIWLPKSHRAQARAHWRAAYVISTTDIA